MFDIPAVVRDLVRHWRGPKTQLEFSLELGWESNVVTHWESGRRVPRLSTCLVMAERRHGGASRLANFLSDHDWASRPPVDSVMGGALLLGDIVSHRPIKHVAAQVGRDEATLHRWLSGKQEPSLADFIEILRRQGLAHIAVRCLSDGAVETAPVPSFTASILLQLLLSDAYRALPHHDHRWLAQRVEASEAQIAEVLSDAEAAGAIRWTGSHWLVIGDLVGVYRREWTDPSELAALDGFTRSLVGKFEGNQFLLCGVARPSELRRIEQIVRDARAEIRGLLATEDPSGTPISISLISARLDELR